MDGLMNGWIDGWVNVTVFGCLISTGIGCSAIGGINY